MKDDIQKYLATVMFRGTPCTINQESSMYPQYQICFKSLVSTVSEFNEFEPRLKSVKNRVQLSFGLNLETLNTIFSETNHI